LVGQSGRSQNISPDKSKVKFDFNTVRTRVLPHLKGIEVKMYPAKIGRARGWSKQHVDYYVRKLEKAGLIRRLKRSNIVDYELTERGQNFLISCEGVLFSSGVFRLHRCFFKFPIFREGVYPAADFRRVEMQNWTALLGLEQGVKVRHTTTSWIVHVETLYGRSPGELVTVAKNLADRVAKGLMCKYGCLLGEGAINKRHELGVDDPVANLLNRYFTVSTPKRVIDDSPGEDEGELDHLGRDAAVEYLMMPERVKKLEGQVGNVLSDLEKIGACLEKLPNLQKLEKIGDNLQTITGILSQLVDAEGNSGQSQQFKGSSSADGGNGYVS
jgi:DNA-binding transcriptional ArsR family regulator